MLHTILLVLILLLEAVTAAMLMAAEGKRRMKGQKEDRPDAEAGEAARRESRMEEGFENLMRFSVSGKDGFGSAGDE